MMISREEMREWLNGQRTRAAHMSLDWSARVIDAILAALEGPSEEERKEMLKHWDSFRTYMMIENPGDCIVCDRIRALILGNPTPETGIKLDPQTEEELRQSDAADKFYDEIMGNPAPEKEEK